VPKDAKRKEDSSKTTCRETEVVRGKVKAPIPIMLRSQGRHTDRSGGEYMGSSSREVRVAGAHEDGHKREWCRRGQRGVRELRSR
jgi:hypothetical protein